MHRIPAQISNALPMHQLLFHNADSCPIMLSCLIGQYFSLGLVQVIALLPAFPYHTEYRYRRDELSSLSGNNSEANVTRTRAPSLPKINQDLRNTDQLPFQNIETLPSGHAVNNKQLAVRSPRTPLRQPENYRIPLSRGF